ncbi:MAG: histidine--tRNA ligase [Clostridia bacterium]|nr:histidine--tRNA ligase [Clostridia bacterium]
MIQKMRGTLDVMPEDFKAFDYIEKTARAVCERYGYKEIRTPTFEATELFSRGVGSTSDVVQKEMYTFEDREGRSLTLRPEGTAGVARAMIEHGRCGGALPEKLFYFINCFRYEAPQAGRSREFFQFGTEMFGAAGPHADATVIALAHDVIKELGIEAELHINSIGCPECRPAHREALKEYFKGSENELCDTCKGRLETNPMRILDCKSPICGKIADGAPRTLDYLCDECKEHFNTLTADLDAMGIKYKIDPRLVRGLDYYTKTVFEFICTGIGAQSTVCGGGRYDGLISELGGPKLPAAGFAMGITRLVLALEAAGVKIPEPKLPELYIAPLGDEAAKHAILLTHGLRKLGIYAECDVMGRSLKSQMKYADKLGARNTLIIGSGELESGKAMLRNMNSGEQREVSFASAEELAKTLAE